LLVGKLFINIGVARGALGARAPQGGEKKLGAKFTGESCKCTHKQRVYAEVEKESDFRKLGDLGGGMGYLGSFSLCFEGDD